MAGERGGFEKLKFGETPTQPWSGHTSTAEWPRRLTKHMLCKRLLV